MGEVPHAEAFSDALHARVLEVLDDDPHHVVRHGRRRLATLRAAHGGGAAAGLVDRWAEMLDGGAVAIRAVLVDPGPEARRLRQASPFAGLLTPGERWAIWRRVRDAA